MLLFFKYDNFLKRKTAIHVFFGSYRKEKYRTFNIETEPSYAETHPKTPTPHLNLMNVTATIFLI
jgi:hypothetical protein